MRFWTGKEFLHNTPVKRLADLTAYETGVREIVDGVRAGGDRALCAYTEQYDGVRLTAGELTVRPEEMQAARAAVSDALWRALEQAKANIAAFHRRQLRQAWLQTAADGSILGQMYQPLERVGIYVPGGTARYPSSVLMTAVPAVIAGVKEIIMCTPPGPEGRIDPSVLAAAELAGVTRIIKAGGAQAIAALAYGTETIPAVDKIVGPGNIYVTAAKKLVYGQVDIDMLAGPSEVLVLADRSANPRWAAADLLAQAEHDQLSGVVLVTTERALAEEIAAEVDRQIEALPRREIAAAALARNGAAVIVEDLAEGIAVVNHYAPEHLELLIGNPFGVLGQIRHAGAIFVGPCSPEPAGDYAAGPNHVLPTGGTARYASALGVDSFRKTSNVIALSPGGLAAVSDSVMTIAAVEGLTAHARAIEVRGEEDV